MTPAEPLRVADLMCDDHKRLVSETRFWPQGYFAGNASTGGATCRDCEVVAARMPCERPVLLPHLDPVERIAIHEAGHAVAYLLHGGPVRHAMIDKAVLRGVVVTELQEHQLGTDAHLIALWAGQAAERRLLLRTGPPADADLIDITNSSFYDCQALAATKRPMEDLISARGRADDLAERHWDAIRRVAAALLSHGRLLGHEIAEYAGLRPPRPTPIAAA